MCWRAAAKLAAVGVTLRDRGAVSCRYLGGKATSDPCYRRRFRSPLSGISPRPYSAYLPSSIQTARPAATEPRFVSYSLLLLASLYFATAPAYRLPLYLRLPASSPGYTLLSRYGVSKTPSHWRHPYESHGDFTQCLTTRSSHPHHLAQPTRIRALPSLIC